MIKKRDTLISLIDLLKKMIEDLNKEEAILIVEGKNDIKALKSFGFRGNIMEYRQSLELLNKEENIRKIILLMDFDKEGKRICEKLYNLLSIKGYKVDLHYWRKMNELKKYGLYEIEDIYSYLKNEYRRWLNESNIYG